MSEPIGEQYRCPECFAELGTPDTPVDQMRMVKERHADSKKCAEQRKIIQYALGKQIEASDPHGSKKAMRGQNVIIEDVVGEDEPDLQEAVIFESPTRFLRIQLRRSRRMWSPDGRLIDHIPAIYARFKDGKFATRDPWMVNSLRQQPNNIEHLERRGVKGTNLFMKKDRFYEVGAVTSRTA